MILAYIQKLHHGESALLDKRVLSVSFALCLFISSTVPTVVSIRVVSSSQECIPKLRKVIMILPVRTECMTRSKLAREIRLCVYINVKIHSCTDFVSIKDRSA